MAVHRSDILNGTMQMLMIIPIDKSSHPFPGCFNRRERDAGVIRPVLACPKQRFRVWVIIADPGTAVGFGYSQSIQLGPHGISLLGAAVVCMKNRWIENTVLGQHSFLDQIRTQLSALCGVYLPANDHPAVYVYDHVQIKIHATDLGREPCDVPGPDLVRASGAKSLRRRMFSGRSAAAPVVLFSGFVQNPVKTGFRGNIHPLVRQSRYDLARGKASIFGVMANRKDLVDFLFCQLVGWLRPFGCWSPIRFDLTFPGPPLICTGADTNDPAGRFKACSGFPGFIDQLYSFAAIRGADHSSSGSPQIAWTFFAAPTGQLLLQGLSPCV